MINKEGSSKIVIFMTRGAGVIILGRGNISHYSEYVFSLFSTLYLYNTMIGIVLKDYAFLCHRWFLFILWLGCCYENMSLSDKKSV